MIKVRGHAPRDAGAKMVVGADHSWGSVGGGNLEEAAVRRARGTDRRRLPAPETQESGSMSTPATARPAMLRRGGDLLLEPLPGRPSVAVFGIGHVGYELARILSRLEIRLHLVDSRADQLDQLRLADVTDGSRMSRCTTPARRAGAGTAPRGAHVADHDPRSRRGFRVVRRRAAPAAAGQHRADRVQLPNGRLSVEAPGKGIRRRHSSGSPHRSGCPGSPGKEPAVIAVGVAVPVLLLAKQPRRCRRRRPSPQTAGRAPAPPVHVMTLFRATIIDTPGDPFTRATRPTPDRRSGRRPRWSVTASSSPGALSDAASKRIPRNR